MLLGPIGNFRSARLTYQSLDGVVKCDTCAANIEPFECGRRLLQPSNVEGL